jgi:4-diphosphocytidyl-2-C-methyl-D-erythritol kinase
MTSLSESDHDRGSERASSERASSERVPAGSGAAARGEEGAGGAGTPAAPDGGGPAGTQAVLRARAAAKINLALLVGPSRADGYHELITVFQSVDLWDELEVAAAPDATLELAVEGAALPADEGNLVLMAAREMTRHARSGGERAGEAGGGVHAAGLPGGAHFRLRKGIPVAAGLGGGSADGAAALLALDRLWRLGVPLPDLVTMAAELGSDVPFCLTGGTCLATGRGERLRPILEGGSWWWVLGISDKGLPTSAVYRRHDELGLGRRLRPADTDGVVAALAAGDPARLAGELVNDLEAAAFHLRPALSAAKQRMLDGGALGAMLSGSGPTMLGLGEDEAHARRVARAVRDAFDHVVVARSPVPGVVIE